MFTAIAPFTHVPSNRNAESHMAGDSPMARSVGIICRTTNSADVHCHCPLHPCPAIEMLNHTWRGPRSQLIINDDVARYIGIIFARVVDGWWGDCIYEWLRLTLSFHIYFMFIDVSFRQMTSTTAVTECHRWLIV
jgi:hypothetical protein